MTRIGIILGSTRPNRNGEQVASWGPGSLALSWHSSLSLIHFRPAPFTGVRAASVVQVTYGGRW